MVRQRQRRPGLIALSVALITGGGLAGAVLFTVSGQRADVLVVARDVPAGARLDAGDLRHAQVALDPSVRAVSGGREQAVIGQRAAVGLKAGSLLSPSEVTGRSLVGPEQQLVGVALKPSQLPASPLSPGERVLVVATPDANAAQTGGRAVSGAPQTVAATVVTVGKAAPATGVVVVDVAVPSSDGPALAAQVATGDVALVVASQDGS